MGGRWRLGCPVRLVGGLLFLLRLGGGHCHIEHPSWVNRVGRAGCRSCKRWCCSARFQERMPRAAAVRRRSEVQPPPGACVAAGRLHCCWCCCGRHCGQRQWCGTGAWHRAEGWCRHQERELAGSRRCRQLLNPCHTPHLILSRARRQHLLHHRVLLVGQALVRRHARCRRFYAKLSLVTTARSPAVAARPGAIGCGGLAAQGAWRVACCGCTSAQRGGPRMAGAVPVASRRCRCTCYWPGWLLARLGCG